MTQKPKRNATEDQEYLTKSAINLFWDIPEDMRELSNYWIEEAEAQRIRAEAAEQERDELLKLLHKIENEYAVYVSDTITAYREGSKPDGQ